MCKTTTRRPSQNVINLIVCADNRPIWTEAMYVKYSTALDREHTTNYGQYGVHNSIITKKTTS
jgi:hypothetical protein